MTLSALTLAGFALASTAMAQRAETTPPDGVLAVVAQFKATEKSSAGADRAVLFSDSALVFNAWDSRYDGRSAVDSLWRGLANSGTFRASTIVEEATTYRRLGEALWLVDYLELLTGQRGPKSGRELPPRHLHMTLIISLETGNHWRIVYYRAADARVNGPRIPAAADSTNLAPRPNDR